MKRLSQARNEGVLGHEETRPGYRSVDVRGDGGALGWVQRKIPLRTQVFDAHTHVGMDVDGREMTAVV